MKTEKEDVFFSVIICCYNSEKFLNETIDSIVNQSYSNWEIVAINDGSTDKTEEIILSYKKRGIPINYTKQSNMGFAYARNKAIELAKGNWILIIDHDDLCMPDRFKMQADQILQNPAAKLFFGDTIHFNNNKIIRKNFDIFDLNKIKLNNGLAYISLLRFGCFIDSESVVFDKRSSLKIGNFNKNYKYIADYDFFIRMGLRYNFSYTTKVLSKWRVHNQQATKTMEKIFTKEYVLLLLQNITSFSTPINLKFYLTFRIIIVLLKKIMK